MTHSATRHPRHAHPLVSFAVGALAFFGLHSSPYAAGESLAALMPERTLVYAEAPGLPELLAQGLEHPAIRTLLESELGQLLLADSEVPPAELLAAGDAALGFPILPRLAALTSDGIALGLSEPTRDGKPPGFVLLLRASDVETARATLEATLSFAGKQAGFPRAFSRPHEELLGADAWKVGDDLTVARKGVIILAANDRPYLLEVLQHMQADRGTAPALNAREDFRAAQAELEGGELAWAWVDRLRLARHLESAGQGEGLAAWASANRKLASQYLLGAGLSALGTADEWLVTAQIEASELTLGLRAHGTAVAQKIVPGPGGASEAGPGHLGLPASFAGQDCLTAVVYRDLSGIYRLRQELFPPELGAELAKQMSQLELFFGGLDLGEEVLPALSPWLRIVSGPLQFEAGLEPEIALPGAAVLFDIDDSQDLSTRLVAAFQSLVGIASVDRAQRGMDPMVLRIVREGATEVSYASFPRPQPGDGVDLRYNLAPACAVVRQTFVIGTHHDIVRRVVRDLEAGRLVETPAQVERLELFGAALADLIEANTDALVMQKVYEDGLSMEAARGEIAGLRAALRLAERALVTVAYPTAYPTAYPAERTGGADGMDGAVEVRVALTLAGAPEVRSKDRKGTR